MRTHLITQLNSFRKREVLLMGVADKASYCSDIDSGKHLELFHYHVMMIGKIGGEIGRNHWRSLPSEPAQLAVYRKDITS